MDAPRILSVIPVNETLEFEVNEPPCPAMVTTVVVLGASRLISGSEPRTPKTSATFSERFSTCAVAAVVFEPGLPSTFELAEVLIVPPALTRLSTRGTPLFTFNGTAVWEVE
jgi:hypothetical protein